jgi:hypothetical protein
VSEGDDQTDRPNLLCASALQHARHQFDDYEHDHDQDTQPNRLGDIVDRVEQQQQQQQGRQLVHFQQTPALWASLSHALYREQRAHTVLSFRPFEDEVNAEEEGEGDEEESEKGSEEQKGSYPRRSSVKTIATMRTNPITTTTAVDELVTTASFLSPTRPTASTAVSAVNDEDWSRHKSPIAASLDVIAR